MTHLDQKTEIEDEDFVTILATFTAFLASFGDKNKFSRFGADFFDLRDAIGTPCEQNMRRHCDMSRHLPGIRVR